MFKQNSPEQCSELYYLGLLTHFAAADFYPVLRGEKSPPLSSSHNPLERQQSISFCCLPMSMSQQELQHSLPEAAYLVLGITPENRLMGWIYAQQYEQRPDQIDPLTELVFEQLPEGMYAYAHAARQQATAAGCNRVEQETVQIGLILALLHNRPIMHTVLNDPESLRQRIYQNAIDKVLSCRPILDSSPPEHLC